MENTNENSEISYAMGIDIKTVLLELWHRKILVLAIIALSLFASFFYTKVLCPVKYRACAKMVITGSSVQTSSTSDYAVALYLIRDCTEIMTDKVVLSQVAEKVGNNYTYARLKGSISIDNPNNSRVLEITVTDTDPENAAKIANAVCEVSKDVILATLDVENANLFSPAHAATSPSSPNIRRNLLIGLAAGIALSIIVTIAIYYSYDKINGSDDVERYLGLSTLAVIPYNRTKARAAKKAVR